MRTGGVGALAAAFVAFATIAGTTIAGTARAAVSLAPHRAVYTLRFAGSPDGDTISAGGDMTFEVRDACTAWQTRQVLDIDSVDRDGTESTTRSTYVTTEAKDGRRFSFAMTEHDDGAHTVSLRGTATIAPGAAGVVRFASPAGLALRLPPGTLFPLAHTRAILGAAEAGERALAPVLFDGTGTDGAEYTYVTIVNWGPTVGPVPSEALAGLASGRIHIAFFPLAGTAMTPEYEIGTRYFANGVGDRLMMDFGGFRLAGDLATLTLPPTARHCPAEAGKG